MYVLFSFCNPKENKLIQVDETSKVESICELLFPQYTFENNQLYSKVLLKGYLYNTVKNVKVCDISVLELDQELQDDINESIFYTIPLIELGEDSDCDSIVSEGESIKTSIAFGSGYAPNLINNSFCGFGFGQN